MHGVWPRRLYSNQRLVGDTVRKLRSSHVGLEKVLMACTEARYHGHGRWVSLGVPSTELRLEFTLPTGQSFRWVREADDRYIGVIGDRVVNLQQSENDVMFRIMARGLPASPKEDWAILHDYFNLSTSLTTLREQWCEQDSHFNKVAPFFPGARMLRQDPVECLFEFICSSNNHISRIHGMVERLCRAYGTALKPCSSVEYHEQLQTSFYAFPSLEQLAQATEEELRKDGFGYRAKFITGAVRELSGKPGGGRQWLLGLRNVPHEQAVEELCSLPGVGPKVAQCVSLFSLDKHAAVPVDTHVWQLAVRHYTPHLRNKTLTKQVMAAVTDALQQRFGPYAGWAHNTLFISELAMYRHLLSPGGGAGTSSAAASAPSGGASKKRRTSTSPTAAVGSSEAGTATVLKALLGGVADGGAAGRPRRVTAGRRRAWRGESDSTDSDSDSDSKGEAGTYVKLAGLRKAARKGAAPKPEDAAEKPARARRKAAAKAAEVQGQVAVAAGVEAAAGGKATGVKREGSMPGAELKVGGKSAALKQEEKKPAAVVKRRTMRPAIVKAAAGLTVAAAQVATVGGIPPEEVTPPVVKLKTGCEEDSACKESEDSEQEGGGSEEEQEEEGGESDEGRQAKARTPEQEEKRSYRPGARLVKRRLKFPPPPVKHVKPEELAHELTAQEVVKGVSDSGEVNIGEKTPRAVEWWPPLSMCSGTALSIINGDGTSRRPLVAQVDLQSPCAKRLKAWVALNGMSANSTVRLDGGAAGDEGVSGLQGRVPAPPRESCGSNMSVEGMWRAKRSRSKGEVTTPEQQVTLSVSDSAPKAAAGPHITRGTLTIPRTRARDTSIGGARRNLVRAPDSAVGDLVDSKWAAGPEATRQLRTYYGGDGAEVGLDPGV